MKHLLGLSIFFLLSVQAFSQWTVYTGPSDNNIRHIWNTGNSFITATDDSVYLMREPGEPWSTMSISPNAPVKSVIIKGSRVFAGNASSDTSNMGLYISDSLGVLFTRYNLPVSGLKKYLAMAVGQSNRIFASADVADSSFVFGSDDEGQTWQPVFALKGSIRNIKLVGTKLYICSHELTGGLWVSNDNGTNWSALTNGIDVPAFLNDIDALTPNTLFVAGAGGTDSTGAIYKSTDNGTTWTKIYTGNTHEPVLGISYNNKGRLFAPIGANGALTSTDSGATWTDAGINQTFAVVRDSAGAIWCNKNKDLVKWEGFNGLSGVHKNDIIFYPNPASSYIRIEGIKMQPDTEMYLLDMLGKQHALRFETDNTTIHIPLDSDLNGSYVFCIPSLGTYRKIQIR